MAKDNNSTNPKKPKFNSWWIYGLIAVLLIGFQFIGSSSFNNTAETTTSELHEFLRNGDVEKILVINNTRQAKVFLTTEALAKEVHKGVSGKPAFLGAGNPQYMVKFGDPQNFEDDIKAIKTENSLDTIIKFDSENNLIADILISVLPFVLIIGIWIYLMRRMSGGGGGGAGGQILTSENLKQNSLMKKPIPELLLKM